MTRKRVNIDKGTSRHKESRKERESERINECVGDGIGAVEATGEFPTQTVEYLKRMRQLVEKGEDKNDLFISRCVEECSGHEESLLSFQESSRLIETLLDGSPLGCTLFLRSVIHLKQRRQKDLLYMGCSSRCIENLIYGLGRIENGDQMEVFHGLVELVTTDVLPLVIHAHSSFVVRALVRVIGGLGRRRGKKGVEEEWDYASCSIKDQLRSIGMPLIQMLTNYNLMAPHIDSSEASLVIQETLDVDHRIKGERSKEMVQEALQGEHDLLEMFKGVNSSRVWEKLLEYCTDNEREAVWRTGTGREERMKELIFHPIALFPLQSLIRNSRSLELTTDVVYELSPLLPSLLSLHRYTFVAALFFALSRHEDLQSPLIKILRRHFLSNTPSTKKDFVFRVLTDNKCGKDEMTVEKATPHGSLLVNSLLSLSHNTSLQEGMMNCPDALIRQMASHSVCSFTLQNFLNSEKVSKEVKIRIVGSFQRASHWQSLIESESGSFVFESLWGSDVVDVGRKMEIMKVLVGIQSTARLWKVAMFKVDAYLFQKDKNAYAMKWKDKGQTNERKEKKWKGYGAREKRKRRNNPGH